MGCSNSVTASILQCVLVNRVKVRTFLDPRSLTSKTPLITLLPYSGNTCSAPGPHTSPEYVSFNEYGFVQQQALTVTPQSSDPSVRSIQRARYVSINLYCTICFDLKSVRFTLTKDEEHEVNHGLEFSGPSCTSSKVCLTVRQNGMLFDFLGTTMKPLI